MKSQFPLAAVYIHCGSHCLNLAVVYSFEEVSVCNNIGVINHDSKFFLHIHATIITCLTPSLHLFIEVTHVMIVAMPIPCLCLHAAFYFLCHNHWFCLHILHLVPVLFSIVIPTSFNILLKCFSHLCTLGLDKYIHVYEDAYHQNILALYIQQQHQ